MNETIKKKLSSRVMWICLAAVVFTLLKELCGFDSEGVLSDLSDVLLALTAAFGIVNNPNDRSSF